MRWLGVLSCIALAALSALGADHGNVEEIVGERLQVATSMHKFLAVVFYSPGCGHCKRLMPNWEKAAELIADQDALEGHPLPIKLAKVDVSNHRNRRDSKLPAPPPPAPPAHLLDNTTRQQVVLPATPKDLEAVLENSDISLVLNCRPDHKGCRRMAPEFAAASLLTAAQLVLVDVSMPGMAVTPGLKLPDLKLIVCGKEEEYHGMHTTSSMVESISYVLQEKESVCCDGAPVC
ncbi:unnamed protein product [Chrysoparadoxa australica]